MVVVVLSLSLVLDTLAVTVVLISSSRVDDVTVSVFAELVAVSITSLVEVPSVHNVVRVVITAVTVVEVTVETSV